jgi:hypothetical protein
MESNLPQCEIKGYKPCNSLVFDEFLIKQKQNHTTYIFHRVHVI